MLNILVVDDSRLARKRVIDTLQSTKVELQIVAEASDGIEALKSCTTLEPDLIVTDIEMPNMDGIELVKELRKEKKKMDIIVISSVANPKVLTLIKEDRNTTFIKKPFDVKAIELVLERISHHHVS